MYDGKYDHGQIQTSQRQVCILYSFFDSFTIVNNHVFNLLLVSCLVFVSH